MNGDKLDDLIKRADWGGSDGRGAWLNTGSGWAYSTSFEPPSSAMFVKRDSSGSKTIGVDQGVRVVDINGDGRSDLIERKDKSGSDYRGAWLNTGSGWLYSSSFEPPSSAAFVDSKGENEGMKIGDANGDGISDLLKRSDGSGSNYRGAWLNNAAKAFLLKQVKTPAGATIDIEYEKSTAYDNTGSDSKSDLPFNINVVKKISENNGVSGTQNSKGVYSYSYKNGFYDSGYADQEFRGFGNVEETKPDTSKVHHWFYQDDAKKGKEYKTEIYDSGKNLYKRTEITWNSKKKNNYYIVTLDKVKDSTFDGKGSYPKVQEISYTYDSYNNPIFISDNGEANHYADEKYQYYDYVYNTNKWIIGKPKTYTLKQSKTGSKQKETRYSYDNLAYGASPTKGKLTKKEEWITGIKYSIKKYQHNSYGNLIKETDPRGYSTSFDYDSTYTYPTKITNAKNQATSNTYDLGTGNLLTTIDPNGYKSSYTYDVFGRKKTEIIPYTTASNPQTEIFYSFNGKAPELILKKEKEKTGAGNTFDTYYFYDGFGKLIQTKTDAENNKQIEKNFYYDGLKRVSAVSNPTLVSNSGYYYAPSSSILKTLYARDALSRVVKVTNPDSTSKKITYDRWNVYHYDENGNRIDYELGVDERIQKITEYYGSQKYDTSYGYNADNSIDQILDHKNNLFQFTYDGIGRLTKLYDPDMGIWQYEYDNSGNLVKQTDANGNKVGITYDELNRPTKKEYVGGKQIFSYDLKVKGTLSGVWTPVVSTVYDYDQRLRKTKESKTIDGTTYTTNYIYDAMNRVTDKTIPSGEKISYTYNSQNKLETITGIVNNIDYNELGKVVKILYPNGLSTLLNYDTKMFRLKNIKTGNKQDLNYIYDNVGNIKTITDKTDSSTKTMNYDSLNRMTSAKKTGTNSYSATYSYDAIGNIRVFS